MFQNNTMDGLQSAVPVTLLTFTLFQMYSNTDIHGGEGEFEPAARIQQILAADHFFCQIFTDICSKTLP